MRGIFGDWLILGVGRGGGGWENVIHIHIDDRIMYPNPAKNTYNHMYEFVPCKPINVSVKSHIECMQGVFLSNQMEHSKGLFLLLPV